MTRVIANVPQRLRPAEPKYDPMEGADIFARIVRESVIDLPIPSDVNAQLASLRQVIDLREKLSEIDSELSKRRQSLESELLGYHESSGLEQVKGGGLSVTFKDDMRTRVDPEQWDAFYRWAVDTHNTQCLYKQAATAKLLDVIAEGGGLPPGVTVESFVKVNTRRV
jgi:hypothetical protein